VPIAYILIAGSFFLFLFLFSTFSVMLSFIVAQIISEMGLMTLSGEDAMSWGALLTTPSKDLLDLVILCEKEKCRKKE
jgi:hypothetical protein